MIDGKTKTKRYMCSNGHYVFSDNEPTKCGCQNCDSKSFDELGSKGSTPITKEA